MSMVQDIIAGVLSPIADIFKVREERKSAKSAAEAKLSLAKQEGFENISLSDQEWEQVMAAATGGSWKDEYVTVSVVSVFNLLVIGGLAAAFGELRVLEGMSLAIQALTAAGVDIGFILDSVILAAVGLSVWRKI